MPHKDPEAKRAYHKAWHIRHKEEVNARSRAWQAANRAYANARSHDYYQQHKDEQNEKSRQTYQQNKTQRRAQQNAYAANHREEAVARTKAWRIANPRRRQNHQTTRRARKKNAGTHTLTHAQWVEIQESQEHCCAYCGKRCKGRLTQDHITPLAQGGSHTLHNVIGACQSCNVRKHTGQPPVPVQPLLLTIAPPKKKKAR